jgi:hypothetical protein
MTITREQRRQFARENAKQPSELSAISIHSLSHVPDDMIEAWRSRDFLVCVYQERDGILRASVNRTQIDPITDRWQEGISWEELQRIKREIGRGHLDAVEVFPSDCDVVNVANMRHLFIMPEPLSFAWRKIMSGRLTFQRVSATGEEWGDRVIIKDAE